MYILSIKNTNIKFLQIPLPEKPNTDDADKIKKWKWSLCLANKQNSERHSQRCDIELKLSVRSAL